LFLGQFNRLQWRSAEMEANGPPTFLNEWIAAKQAAFDGPSGNNYAAPRSGFAKSGEFVRESTVKFESRFRGQPELPARWPRP